MAETATVIMLTAGSVTFVNEWYQTQQINWRIPIATMLGAFLMDGLSKLDEKAATGLSVMVLIGALVTRFNGHSFAETVSQWLNSVSVKQQNVKGTKHGHA